MQNFFRTLTAQLSYFFKNKKINKKLEKRIISEINFLNRKTILPNKNKLKTHVLFNIFIKKLIFEKKMTNFLRENFIQKIFFVHNRIYILMMLLKIIFNKNKIYKKLILEDNIGNPVRYFLYKKSSGNRIREVFHLLNFENFIKIPISKIRTVMEFGGGYGNMARIFYKINKNVNYTIFDTYSVNLLQYYYLKMLNIPVKFNHKNIKNITLNHKISKCIYNKNNNKKLFIANWSLSESPIKLRKVILKKIINFDFILISYQKKFETINNHKYFENFIKLFKEKNYIISRKIIPFMNLLNIRSNHYYLFIKKNNI
jgi:hypothetical protein